MVMRCITQLNSQFVPHNGGPYLLRQSLCH